MNEDDNNFPYRSYEQLILLARDTKCEINFLPDKKIVIHDEMELMDGVEVVDNENGKEVVFKLLKSKHQFLSNIRDLSK